MKGTMRRSLLSIGLLFALLALSAPAQAQPALPMGIPHLCASDPNVVVVAAGETRTLNGQASCVEVIGKASIVGSFTVTTILVYPGGDLTFADGSTTIFRDAPIDTVADPEQWGHGLVVVDGKVRAAWQVKTPFVRLAVEPLAGATTLTLSAPCVGCLAGDQMFVPDTRQVPDTHWFNPSYALQHETATIASVNGLTVTLTAPLAFSHRGARNADGSLFTLPHVANLTRSIKIRSENPTGVRGHIAFIGRADVNLSGVEVSDMGRTTPAPLHSTIGATIGTNQIGRYPVHFHHLSGPVNPTNTGYQYQFVGNVIRDSRKWPLAIHGSHYGLVEGNVVVGGAELTGAGIALEDGSETENLIRGNFVGAIRGHVNPNATGPNTLNGSTPGSGGECIWAGGFNNRFVGNVVAGCRNASQNVAAGPGFKFATIPQTITLKNPRVRGADLNLPAETLIVNPQRQPLLQFDDNEVYGLSAVGMTLWYLNTNGYQVPTGVSESVVRRFRVWHVYDSALWLYPVNRLTVEDLAFRVDGGAFSSSIYQAAVTAGDYRVVDFTMRGGSIHAKSIAANLTDPLGTFRFEGITAVTREHAYRWFTPSTPGTQAARVSGVAIQIFGGSITAWPGQPLRTIAMTHHLLYTPSDTTNPFTVEVQPTTGAAYRAYFPIQLNANLYGGFSPCGDTTTRPEVAGITCGSVVPPPPTPVDCVWGVWPAFPAWPTTWTPNGDGTESRTRTRTRTVATPASNGGAPCTGSATEIETETRVIPPPTNPCVVTPLVIPVTRWPTRQTGESTSGTWTPGSFVLVKASFEWLPTLRFVAVDARGCSFLQVK